MIIYHLVPKAFYNKQTKNAVYLPKPFAKNGFINSTREPREMARIPTPFDNQERGPHVYLYIDTRKVKAKVQYDDAAKKYPHIYGGLNHDAIIAIKPAKRDAQGNFQSPEKL